MTLPTLLKQPSAFVPLAISGAALAMIGLHVAIYGTVASESGDEGAAAHLFQLLMLGQVLVIGTFAVKWLPRAPKQALLVLALQVAAWVVPVALIIFLESNVSR
jgi:hypothetical protein